jgi:speckle-type POZ protein
MSRCDRRLSIIVASYSKKKKLANGRCLRSTAVAAAGHTWRIAFYPNGRLAGITDSVSIYLVLDDGGAGAGARADGGCGFRVESKFTLQEVGLVSTVAGAIGGGRQEPLGCERFVSREELDRLESVVNRDWFVIQWEFTVSPAAGVTLASGSGMSTPAVATPPPPQPSVQQPAPPAAGVSRAPPPSSSPPPAPAVRALRSMSGLPADLGRLLETEAGSDVDFEVCGRVFSAHKLVLAARSPVFMADFFGPAMEKATGYIRICDMHPDVFEALLHYIYTDTLPATATSTTTATAREEAAALAQDLLVAADRYNLKDLKSITENMLCKHGIGVSTVLPILALAEHHQCLKLKKMCLEFIAAGSNTRAVMATDDVEHLARSCPPVVREVIGEILDARDATPRNALMSFYFYACIFAMLSSLWALILCWCV